MWTISWREDNAIRTASEDSVSAAFRIVKLRKSGIDSADILAIPGNKKSDPEKLFRMAAPITVGDTICYFSASRRPDESIYTLCLHAATVSDISDTLVILKSKTHPDLTYLYLEHINCIWQVEGNRVWGYANSEEVAEKMSFQAAAILLAELPPQNWNPPSTLSA